MNHPCDLSISTVPVDVPFTLSNIQAVDVARLWGQIVASCQHAASSKIDLDTAGIHAKDEDDAMMDLGGKGKWQILDYGRQLPSIAD